MTSQLVVMEGKAIEDRPCWLIGRLCAVAASGAVSPRSREGRLVRQVDINGTTLTAKAFDESGVQIGTTLSPLKVDVIFDTLQTGETWGLLAGGGNMRWQAPASFFPEGGRVVRVEISGTLTDAISQPTGIWNVSVVHLDQS